MERLRDFNKTVIGQDCKDLTGHHENELFFECEFKNLTGLTLKDCVLDRSRFTTDSIREALDFTMTLSCHSFNGVEYSPLLFDLLLTLITMTKGNEEKRAKLIDVVGKNRYETIRRVLNRIE
jgi:hypothetical protein